MFVIAESKRQKVMIIVLVTTGILSIFVSFFFKVQKLRKDQQVYDQRRAISPVPSGVVEVSPSPTATPSTTPKQLSFSDLNHLYGPCTNLPVLMYHHVEPLENAKKYKRTGLDVPPEMFRSQMQYLKDKGYSFVTPTDLINFFDNGTPLPGKPVMITFDDGYVDIGDEAFPIMRELGVKGIVYVPTGLMENFDYLTWAKINEMQVSGNFTFGNHTWSHSNVGKNHDIVTREITTADNELNQKGLDQPKTFAYPYGLETSYAEKLLSDMGYKLAFTTVHGRIMCKGQRLSLPRIRIGNSKLSAFGL